ncbi:MULTISPECIES: hypothetical protein [Providencia]|uniref:hypothetical protein n=1 Tax=Providencia TaxID=586 RepID=UPI001299C57A|nr:MULTISPECIES: hypothetical protein [Providencia]MCK9788237.1 hypothetical protein [Providencia rettgeri]MDX7425303.1 hypothetical protein [Providencia sp. CIM-Carb-044]MRF67378.1 hypothetical protein [Escherichia coli]QNP22015.1 hypothetical protein H9L31_09320 [Providencia rettgeri]
MNTKNDSITPNYQATKSPKISQFELVEILNSIKSHSTRKPEYVKSRSVTIQYPYKYFDGSELQAIKASRQEERRIYREKCQTAFKFNQQNSMKGGIFSLAQQLANRSRQNILAIDNQDNITFSRKKLFQPQTRIVACISALGYALFG